MGHTPKIHLSGHVDVPVNDLAMFETAVAEHIRLSRAENGCEHFDIVPEGQIAGRFAVTEVFTNRAAFDSHTARTRASSWWEATKHIPRNIDLSEK